MSDAISNRSKKNLFVLALGAILVLGVTFNELVLKSWTTTNASDRNVASIASVSSASQIDWERELIESYNTNSTSDAVVGTKPSLHDELVFGFFEGKYGAKLSALGQVEAIEYLGQNTEDLISIDNKVGFLLKFKDVIAESAVEAQFVGVDEGEEVYKLLSQAAQVVGLAKFKLNGNGQVKSVQFSAN